MGAFSKIFQRLRLTADTSVTTQTSTVIQADTTNASLVLAPNGTGAIIASIPDGTATGGNARGSYSVDLQRIRSASNRVADGDFSVIVGGQSNGMNGLCTDSFIGGGKNNFMDYFTQRCVIVGGENNNLSNNTNHSFIGGGLANSVSVGDYATIPGGGSNAASSNYSTISGGQSNTASTNTHATVIGGQGNTSSGQHSVSGGSGNTASGTKSVALGLSALASGQGTFVYNSTTEQSTASGNYSVIFSVGASSVTAEGGVCFGYNQSITNAYASTFGSYVQAYLRGQHAKNGGYRFGSTNGSIQESTIIPFKQDTLTTGATSSLSLDGTGTTNLIIPSGANRTWNTTVNWVATVTGSSGTTTGVTVGNSIYGVSEFGFKVSASIASITPLIRDSIVADTAIMETATLTYATGSSNSLAMTFTAPTFAGGGSLGMRVVAKVSLVELAW